MRQVITGKGLETRHSSQRANAGAVRSISAFAVALVLMSVGSGTVSAQADRRVVATTAWTAAFATAAGARSVDILAPFELRHPPEYELRATDIARVTNADLVVFAGYEAMVGRLRQAIGGNAASGESPAMLQIATDHSMATLETSIRAIAAVLGTQQTAERNIAELRNFLAGWRTAVATSELAAARVVVHAFQRPVLGELGVVPVGQFGPGPMTARQIAEITALAPTVVIDVWHNEAATPLRETLPNATFVSWINFPGRDGTRSIMDVLRLNRGIFDAAFAR